MARLLVLKDAAPLLATVASTLRSSIGDPAVNLRLVSPVSRALAPACFVSLLRSVTTHADDQQAQRQPGHGTSQVQVQQNEDDEGASAPATQRGLPRRGLSRRNSYIRDLLPLRLLSRFARETEDEISTAMRWLLNRDAYEYYSRGEANGFMPLRLDMRDTGKEIVIKADVPGVKDDNIQVRISEDRVLTIVAEPEVDEDDGGLSEGCRRTERPIGVFMRRLQLPEDVDLERVTAKVEHGVREVRIAKTEEQGGTEVKVQSGDSSTSATADTSPPSTISGAAL